MGCAFRNATCHAGCDGYKEFTESVKEWRETVKTERQTEIDADAVRRRRIRSIKRTKRKAGKRNGK